MKWSLYVDYLQTPDERENSETLDEILKSIQEMAEREGWMENEDTACSQSLSNSSGNDASTSYTNVTGNAIDNRQCTSTGLEIKRETSGVRQTRKH